jgi:hypothetical protein
MGTTHWRSNLAGFAGSETITGFDKIQGDDVVCGTLTATKIAVGGALSAANITSTNYIKCGTNKGIVWGNINTVASVVTAVRAVLATPAHLKGSLYLSDKGKIFTMLTSKSASSLDTKD